MCVCVYIYIYIYINPKDSTKKLLELRNKFIKLQDTKSIYKNMLLTLSYQRNLSNPRYSCIKKNKIPWDKFSQGIERPVL